MSQRSGRIRKVSVKSVRTVRADESTSQGTGDDSEFSDSAPSSPKKFKTSTSGSASGDQYNYFFVDMEGVRRLFLRGMALVYFVAFLSIYLQTEGIYGSNGVTPAKSELKLASIDSEQCFKEKMTLLCLLSPQLGISVSHSMEIIELIGIVLSSFGVLCVNCCVTPVMMVLWVLYFSIYQVGGIFLWYQWDNLLLEAGLLAILAAPWLPAKSSFASKPRDVITMNMVKWLLFRLMFSSGIVKLQSSCPAWWSLNALIFHFESQCLPTPASYMFHHLPHWLLSIFVIGAYYIEILVPFGFFAPTKAIRHLSFWLQVSLQGVIILTGNYNFFNILTIVLCFALLDSSCFQNAKSLPTTFSLGRVIVRSFSFIVIGMSLFFTGKYFGVKLNSDYTLSSKIAFNRVQFDEFVSHAVPISIGLGVISLTLCLARALLASIFDVRGAWNKLCSLFSVIVYGGICAILFAVTLVPYTTLHKETNAAIHPQLRELHANLNKFHITSSYGLFRRMTGTDGYRQEVILEYADDMAGPWKEYEFLYKPGNLSAAPQFIVPHQPRLDWQMWFAALSTYHDSPWLVSLTYRLLKGEESVEGLLDQQKNPVNPPKFIRASLYHYSFTNPLNGKGDWWIRKRSGDYMPIFAVDHPPLVDFLKKLGYFDADLPAQIKPNTAVSGILDSIRAFFQSYRPEYVIWAALVSLGLLVFTSRLA